MYILTTVIATILTLFQHDTIFIRNHPIVGEKVVFEMGVNTTKALRCNDTLYIAFDVDKWKSKHCYISEKQIKQLYRKKELSSVEKYKYEELAYYSGGPYTLWITNKRDTIVYIREFALGEVYNSFSNCYYTLDRAVIKTKHRELGNYKIGISKIAFWKNLNAKDINVNDINFVVLYQEQYTRSQFIFFQFRKNKLVKIVNGTNFPSELNKLDFYY